MNKRAIRVPTAALQLRYRQPDTGLAVVVDLPYVDATHTVCVPSAVPPKSVEVRRGEPPYAWHLAEDVIDDGKLCRPQRPVKAPAKRPRQGPPQRLPKLQSHSRVFNSFRVKE